MNIIEETEKLCQVKIQGKNIGKDITAYLISEEHWQSIKEHFKKLSTSVPPTFPIGKVT